MTDFTILAEGYVTRKQGVLHASSTVVLLQDSGHTIIVDPGLDRKSLQSAMKKWDLTTDEVDYVVITHQHPDHTLLAGMFQKAKVVDSKYIYWYDGSMAETGEILPGSEIKILFTPGHDISDCSLVIKTREYGTVAIVGDVLWWMDGDKYETTMDDLIKREDPYAYDMENLLQSRKIVLGNTDYIIPGHGKMFHVPR